MRGCALALVLCAAVGSAVAVRSAFDSPASQVPWDELARTYEELERPNPLELQEHAGQLLPDVTAYDAEGNPVRLRDLVRDEWSVLVFGCLT